MRTLTDSELDAVSGGGTLSINDTSALCVDGPQTGTAVCGSASATSSTMALAESGVTFAPVTAPNTAYRTFTF
jgi:hypothetical protein